MFDIGTYLHRAIGVQIFQKCKKHLKILGSTRMTRILTPHKY